MKGMAIYFLFLGSASPAPAPATGTGAGKTSNVNNSALGGHRALPKVANENKQIFSPFFEKLKKEEIISCKKSKK